MSFSGQREEFTSDGQEVAKDDKPAVAFHQDNELDIFSAGLEYKVQLFSVLDMVMGYSHHWQSREIGNDDDKGSYMIGAGMDITDTTTLRASYARKIRFPSIKQLYEPASGKDLNGNPGLTTEQSSNYEAGITQKLFWEMELDLAVFQNNVEDYIEKDNINNQNQNNEEYRFKGVEIYLTKAIMDRGSVGIGYSYLDTEDKSAGSEKDELQYRPTHKFTVDVTYAWDFGLTAHADFMQVNGQYYYSRNTPLKKRELNDYSIVNLKLEQKLYRENFFIYLGADNLLDEDYEESYGYPQPGRTAYAGLRVKF
jgi:outer membrane cobalamin receptor